MDMILALQARDLGFNSLAGDHVYPRVAQR